METPTEIIITRIGQKTWKFNDNINVNDLSRSIYSGIRDGDLIGITDYRGATLYNLVNYAVYSYVDNVDPENSFTPTSADQLFAFLNDLDYFFYKGNTGGGGGSITDYTVLGADDVNIPTLAGQQGKVFGVNPAGTAFVLLPNAANTFSIVGATDWAGGALQPFKYLTTNSTGTKVVQSDIGQVINTPIEVDEFRVVAKGVNDGVPNVEPFVKEVGDFCEGVYSVDGRRYYLIYNGGTDLDFPLKNYVIIRWDEPLMV